MAPSENQFGELDLDTAYAVMADMADNLDPWLHMSRQLRKHIRAAKGTHLPNAAALKQRIDKYIEAYCERIVKNLDARKYR